MSSTTMACVIPSFMSDTQLPTNVSYTIRIGDAPGPNLTKAALTLSVVPDPIFATDGSAIVGGSEQTIGSGALLVINVSVHWSMFGCGCIIVIRLCRDHSWTVLSEVRYQ